MNLKIAHWNVRHFFRNNPAISEFCQNTKPHILCLNETWTQPSSKISLPGYNLVSHKPRTSSKGGGVAILATPSTPVTTIQINSNLEVCAGSIYLNQTTLSIISLYISPQYENQNLRQELDDFLQNIPSPYLICT